MISPARHLTMNGHQSNQKAMKKIIIIASLIGGSLLLAGCQKEFGKGGEVRFVASSVAGPQTRAEYSGEGTTNSDGLLTWERINWVSGDQLRIWSDGAKTQSAANYSDYKVSDVNIKAGDPTRSQAKVQNAGSNGLTWNGVESACGFWAVYPASMAGTGTGKTVSSLSISASQRPSDGLTKAPMVAAVEGVAPNKAVTLEFYPAFTAFEITLASEDVDIALKSVALTSTSTALSGSYTATIAPGGETTYDCTSTTKRVDYTFPSGTSISKTHSETFTILAIPQVLKDLTLEFNVEIGGVAVTRKLALKQNNNFISFNACSKHRIYGLAMPGGDLWQLTIRTDVNEWVVKEATTTFKEQIGIRGISISGGTETGNHYEEYNGYDKYYQIRTLDMSAAQPHFVLKFTPFAPLGGYWTLVPEAVGEGGLEHFDVKVYLGEGEYSNELIGQIMGNEVEIHIFPKDFDPEVGVSYAMILKSFVSAQKTFDTPYSADSEFQDVHGDGRYSYWRFTLPSSN